MQRRRRDDDGREDGDPPTHECYGGWQKHELGVCNALGGVHTADLAEANRSICRLATNAWKSIRAGNDFATVGDRLTSMSAGASYEATCENAAAVCTNLVDGEMSMPLLEDGALSFYRVSSPTAGVCRISRIAFQLQKPRKVLSKEETEVSLVEKAIDAEYERWLKSK